MKKIPNWIYVVIVFALLISSKFIFFAKKEDKAKTGGKPSGPISVNYIIATQFDFKTKVYSSGKIGALNEVEIKPEVAGKITAIYFKEGEQVNKGSVLIKINDADIQAQLSKNKIQLKLAELKLERLKKLIAINGVSQEEYDIQDNEVNTLKADQAFLIAQIAKTSIAAPFNGVIGLKNVSEGAYVSPNNVIASLVQLKPVFIEFSVPERYSEVLSKNMKVKFSKDGSINNKEFEAVIYAIEPKIDDITKTLRSRAIFSGNELFYPGTFVKVFVEINDNQNSLMIPTQSIIPVLKGQKVLICKNGVAEERMVVTGIRTDDKIQILEGLNQGDTVLTTGLLVAKAGANLKLIKSSN